MYGALQKHVPILLSRAVWLDDYFVAKWECSVTELKREDEDHMYNWTAPGFEHRALAVTLSSSTI